MPFSDHSHGDISHSRLTTNVPHCLLERHLFVFGVTLLTLPINVSMLALLGWRTSLSLQLGQPIRGVGMLIHLHCLACWISTGRTLVAVPMYDFSDREWEHWDKHVHVVRERLDKKFRWHTSTAARASERSPTYNLRACRAVFWTYHLGAPSSPWQLLNVARQASTSA